MIFRASLTSWPPNRYLQPALTLTTPIQPGVALDELVKTGSWGETPAPRGDPAVPLQRPPVA